MDSLKYQFLEGASGLTSKLLEAFELGRRFILPVYDQVTLANAVNISTTSPHFTIANSGSNSAILAGYTIQYNDGSNWVEKTVASPVVAGSTFDVTVAPSAAASNKAIMYSSIYPSSYTTLLNGMLSAAAAGKSTFDVLVDTSDNPTYLRLQGDYMKAYFAGIYYALGQEEIFNTYEIALSLDVSNVSATKVKFSFTF